VLQIGHFQTRIMETAAQRRRTYTVRARRNDARDRDVVDVCIRNGVGPFTRRMTCYVARTRVVVDNRKGADARFAAALQEALGGAGFEVEARKPTPQTLYDTRVHFVVEGVSVRVPAEISRRELALVAAAVRDAEARRCSERQRSRDVPIYQGETSRVLAWVDVFGSARL
jgi:hypothetical protein